MHANLSWIDHVTGFSSEKKGQVALFCSEKNRHGVNKLDANAGK